VRLRWALVVLLVAGAAAVFAAAPARAHALLKRSVPADGSTVSKAPDVIQLFFTEPPEPSLSAMGILDSSGHSVPGMGTPEVVPGDPEGLQASVRSGALPNGVYTVTWRTVSKTDGHVTAGSIAFGVGVPATAASTGGGAVPSTPSPTAPAVAARWLFYWGLALLLGGAVAGGFLFAWTLPAGGRALVVGAWVAAAAGVVLMTAAERSTVGLPLGTLLSSLTGRQLIAEAIGVALCGAAVIWVIARPARASLVALAVAVAATMFVHVQAGHADAQSSVRILNLLDQWIHLLAVGVWIGGLPWLLLGLGSGEPGSGAERAGRFAVLATVSLVVVALTGVLRSIPEVGSLHGLFHTSFGVTLLVKTGLFLVLLGLGARNHFQLVPRARGDGGDESTRTLRRSVTAEVAVAAAILAVTGVLSELPPSSYVGAATKPAAPQQIVAVGSDFATTVRVRLTASPGTVGPNTFTARATDFDTGAPVGAQGVELQFSLPSNPDVASTLELKRAAAGTWTGTGTNLSIDGHWNVQVVIQGASSSTDVSLALRTTLPPEHITSQSASGQPTIYTIGLPGGRQLQTYVDPGTPGPNTIHYTFFDASGNEQPISRATASAEAPSGATTDTKLLRFSAGHFAANVTLGAGRWIFFIDATTDDGTALTAYFAQTIGQ
jgi:copper transport protein